MFDIDDRIRSTSFILGEWPLSTVLLKNEQAYPWLILVPRHESVQEIYQLSKQDRALLMEEINQLSLLVQEYFKPEKLNIGALGNIVAQLHVHVIGRNKQDSLWPQGVWQSSHHPNSYTEEQLKKLLPDLQALCKFDKF